MKSKLGRGEATQEELQYLQECRSKHPDQCSKLEKEVRHRAMEAMNPFYVQPEDE